MKLSIGWRGIRVRRLVAVLWAFGSVSASLLTWLNENRRDFDGLNNLWQLLFAFPWALLPTANWGPRGLDFWILAIEGIINAYILHWWFKMRERTRHQE